MAGTTDGFFSSFSTQDIAQMSMGLQGFGAGWSMMGAYNQAVAQQNSLEYMAQVAANNAIVAGYQASIAKDVGATQEQNSRLRTGQVYGAQRAALAANGIDLGEGSATDVLTTTKYMGERDALTIRDNASRTAWAYEQQGKNYQSQANAYQAQADNISPFASAAGSLLTSAASVASSYLGYKKAGIF